MMDSRRRIGSPFTRLFRRHWVRMLAGMLLGLLSMIAGIGLLALAGWFISAAAFAGLAAGSALAFNFFYPSIGVRLFAIGRTLTRYAERIVSHDVTFRILESLRVWFYTHLEPRVPAVLSAYRSGDVLNRIVADIDALDNLYLRVLSPTAVAIITALLLALFLWWFDPLISLTAFGCLLLSGFGVPTLAHAAGADNGRKMAQHAAALRVHIVDTVTGLPELLVFGTRQRAIAPAMRASRRLIETQRRMSRIRGATAAAGVMISGLAMLGVLFLGVRLVNLTRLQGVNLALILLAVLAAFESVAPLATAYQYLELTRTSARRLMEITTVPPAVRFPAAPATQPPHFSIRFENVYFQYPGRTAHVLRGIDLHIRPGEKVVVLGATGSGKSTLVHLLARFHDPDSGAIRIGGADIRTFSETQLRRWISVVPQDVHLFNASIRENLQLAAPDASENDLRTALATVQLISFVENLPRGLDTWIGASGKLLSGGQARRLAAARLVLHDAPLWLLDEPTEGLDTLTARRLMETLLAQADGKSVLWITHRLDGLRQMDRIVLIERGRIAEQGTHDELLAHRTRYAALHAGLNFWQEPPEAPSVRNP